MIRFSLLTLAGLFIAWMFLVFIYSPIIGHDISAGLTAITLTSCAFFAWWGYYCCRREMIEEQKKQKQLEDEQENKQNG